MKIKSPIKLFALYLLIISIAIPVITADPEDYGYCGGMMSGFYGGYGTGFIFILYIISILLIILLAAGIYWLIKNANKKK